MSVWKGGVWASQKGINAVGPWKGSLWRSERSLTSLAIRKLLFSQGQQGVMYVPQPTVDGQQVLFQDAAGTTPVTADGDPVGRMADLSGNGNHATQSTAAAKMLLSGGQYLLPDGVDDNFDVALGANFTGDFALILDTGPIFGAIDTKTDTVWRYTKNAAYIPDGKIHALIVRDAAFSAAEKQAIIDTYAAGITTVPTTAVNAFRSRTDLTALDTSYGDWTQVTSASYTFLNCSSFTAPPDVSGWTQVTDARFAFYQCYSLTTPPDVSGWTQVTDAGHAFRDCSSLTTPPDVSGWTQVTDAYATFYNCSSLTTPPDVSGWTQVTDARLAFRDCSSLTTPPDVSGWTQVTSASYTFYNCSSLTTPVNITNWNPLILTDGEFMMSGISAAGFDQASYDAALIAWDTAYDLTLANTLSIHFGSAKYTAGGAAEAARTQLVNAGWTITDGGAAV